MPNHNYLPALAALLLTALMAAGCSQVPQATGHTYSTQKKMQAVQHWDVLAADISNQVAAGTDAGQVFVAPPPEGASPFRQGFHELLVTNLVNQGFVVHAAPAAGVPVFEYQLQTVRHLSGRPPRRPIPGTFTALAGGLAVMRDAAIHSSVKRAVIGGALAGAVAADVMWDSTLAATDHELLVTSYVTLDNQYLFRRSDIYYINGADAWHYRDRQAPARPAKNLEITG